MNSKRLNLDDDAGPINNRHPEAAYQELRQAVRKHFSNLKRVEYKIIDLNIFKTMSHMIVSMKEKDYMQTELYPSVLRHLITQPDEFYTFSQLWERSSGKVTISAIILLALGAIGLSCWIFATYFSQLTDIFSGIIISIGAIILVCFVLFRLMALKHNRRKRAGRAWTTSLSFLSGLRFYTDLATDVLLIIVYYQNSQSIDENNETIVEEINYNDLFRASLAAMILSRIIVSIIVYIDFSHDWKDFWLQMFFLRQIKLVYVHYDSKRYIKTISEYWFELLDALFSAAPELLISSYTLVTQIIYDELALSVVLSVISSVYGIAADCTMHDKRCVLQS